MTNGTRLKTASQESCHMTSISDYDLIMRIKEARDKNAFQSLYERYKKPAYNLALSFTRNRDAAEDVVQESMLQIWNTSSFQQEGSARGWILRIVTTNAFKNLRNKGRSMRRERASVPPESTRQHSELDGSAEQAELLTSLRARLQELADEDGKIIALYFGLGDSQEQISKKLKIPPRTVSFRIKKVLENLKRDLAHIGFAALNGEQARLLVNEAILNGVNVPRSLDQKVLESLDKTDTAIPEKGPVAFLATTVITLAIISGVIWAGWRLPNDSPPSDIVDLKANPAKIEAPIFPRTWDFDSGIPEDLIRVEGEWEPGTHPKMGPSGALHAKKLLKFILPIEVKNKVVVSFDFFYPGGEAKVGMAFVDWPIPSNRELNPSRESGLKLFAPHDFLSDQKQHHMEIFADPNNHLLYSVVDNELQGAFVPVNNPSSSNHTKECAIMLRLQNVFIDNLHIRKSINQDEDKFNAYENAESFMHYLSFNRYPLLSDGSVEISNGVPTTNAQDNSIALGLNGSKSATTIFLRSGGKNGEMNVFRFDYCPLDQTATEPGWCSTRFYSPSQAPADIIKFFERLKQKDHPKKSTSAQFKGLTDKRPLYQKRWYRVALLCGREFTAVIVDGRPPYFMFHLEPAPKVRYAGLRFHGHCRVDNFRMRTFPTDYQFFLKYLKDDGFTLKADKAVD